MFDVDDSCVDRAVWCVGPADRTVAAIATVTAGAAITATVPWLSGGGGKTSRGIAS